MIETVSSLETASASSAPLPIHNDIMTFSTVPAIDMNMPAARVYCSAKVSLIAIRGRVISETCADTTKKPRIIVIACFP